MHLESFEVRRQDAALDQAITIAVFPSIFTPSCMSTGMPDQREGNYGGRNPTHPTRPNMAAGPTCRARVYIQHAPFG